MDFTFNKRKCVTKKKFTPEEDEQLKMLVQQHGEYNWEKIAILLGNRNARQCHDRWKFYVNPTINKEPFTQEEDWLLINLVYRYGGMWVQISKNFKNRSDVQMKNRWKILQKQMNLSMPNYSFLTNSTKNKVIPTRKKKEINTIEQNDPIQKVIPEAEIQENPFDAFDYSIFNDLVESPNPFF